MRRDRRRCAGAVAGRVQHAPGDHLRRGFSAPDGLHFGVPGVRRRSIHRVRLRRKSVLQRLRHSGLIVPDATNTVRPAGALGAAETPLFRTSEIAGLTALQQRSNSAMIIITAAS